MFKNAHNVGNFFVVVMRSATPHSLLIVCGENIGHAASKMQQSLAAYTGRDSLRWSDLEN